MNGSYSTKANWAGRYAPFGMGMVGREWGSEEYRYGFNGQEQDTEIYGANNAYSFEYRVHDPRLGRFLSVDPLAPQYAWNSPYAFAENRPIDGIDLEGLEYLKADEALIESKNGVAYLKIENFSNPYKYAHYQKPWTPNSIGVNTIFYQFTTEQYTPVASVKTSIAPQLELSFSNDDTNPNANLLKVENPTTKQSNNTVEDKRYKEQYISGVANGRSAALVTLAIDGTNAILNGYANKLINSDNKELQKQISEVFKNALSDLNTGTIGGYVPETYQNKDDLSSILNVIISGVNLTDNQEIFDIGISIVKNISENYNEIVPYNVEYTGSGGLDGFTGNEVLIPITSEGEGD